MLEIFIAKDCRLMKYAAGFWMAKILKWELPLIMLSTWVTFVSIPIYHGGIGLSSDALNHHIYLGWEATHLRFNNDFLAVSYQAYQFPYLYWPVYKMASSGFSGLCAGIVLVTIQMVAVPPLWMMSRTCLPEATGHGALTRALAVFLAFSSAVILMSFDSTSNDFLAAAPFVWAMAFAMRSLEIVRSLNWWSTRKCIVFSGICAGVSIALKLSNGPLVLLLPVIWIFVPGGPRVVFKNIVAGCAAVVSGFILTYGYWGMQLWVHFGNPLYPFYDELFGPIRTATGWLP